MKQIDLSLSVHQLCTRHPEIKDILAGLGFADIAKPGMLQTAGRFMTIPKGAGIKGIPLEAIIEALRRQGFDITEGGCA